MKHSWSSYDEEQGRIFVCDDCGRQEGFSYDQPGKPDDDECPAKTGTQEGE